MAGVIGMGLWHAGGSADPRAVAERPPTCEIPRRRGALQVVRRMGIRRRVRLLASARVESPITFGWLRPVIMAPVSVLTGLAPDQLDAILRTNWCTCGVTITWSIC